MNASVKTSLPGPNSARWRRLKDQYVSRAVSPVAPNLAASGQGALLRDIDGNSFLDFTGGWGCLIVGYSHPKVVAAVRDQAEKYLHTDFTAVMYESYIELAQQLVARAPGKSPKKAAFFNSGAEAVENAVKFARVYTKRKAVVVFEGAFHGRTLLTMTMTHKAKPYKEGFGPLASDVYRAPYPNGYRNPTSCEHVERSILTQVSPSDIACLVVEPMQGEGGFVVPRDDFLPFLRDFADRHGIMLVLDEIQSGYGRTGKFFAHEHWGIEADLITVGKSIASGLPLSGVIGKAEVMDAPAEGAIGGTYSGNPIACVAALAVLAVIDEEHLLPRARAIGRIMAERFGAMQKEHRLIGDVRGLGAMVAIEMVRDPISKEPASDETAAILREALRAGVILAKAGLYGNVIRLLVPLVITDEQLAEGLDVIAEAIQTVSAVAAG